MITTSLNIKNPWSKDVFVSFFEYDKKISKNKHMEFQRMYSDYNLFEFKLSLVWKGEDHAGPSIEVGVVGFCISLKIYDVRHWDYKKGKWKNKF